MTIPTQAQINLLRSRPQSTKLYLSIYQPKTIFSARVTGTFSQGDAQINYYSVLTGTWQNIYPNMVAKLGTTENGDELGQLRIRNATGTYITFAENEIVWQNGMYLTLVDYIDISAIYPRIIQDPNNQTNVIFYKDYDIPYSNQNSIYGTFPCAGPHRAGFIVTGAYGTYWSSTGTYNVKGDALTYSWAFEGGTPTGSTSKDPGLVQYTSPGHFKTRLITTSASGAVDVTYRYVSVYRKPNQGTPAPIQAWSMDDLSGSRGESGYTTRLKIMSILPEIQPKALVVLFKENSYGGNIVSLGGNSIGNESIFFVGYILQDSIRFNYEQSTMEFDVGSISELMRETEGFSVSCESKAAASTWYELTEMTVQKALYHYLRWHSTVLNVTDFQYTGDDRYVQYFDSDRESLYDAVDNFVRNGLLGSVISNRQGKLWAEISPEGLETPFSIPTNMSLNKQDWMGDVSIQERRGSATSFIELGGIAYYGVATNGFSALISNAPGITPLYRGKVERQEGLILVSQAQLNQIAANYLANKNTQYPDVSMSLNGDYSTIDIAPLEKFNLVIARGDTIRDVSLQDKPYIPTSMTWRYNSSEQTLYPDLTFEQIATGTASETVLIPATPPNEGFQYPSLSLPPLPVFNQPNSVGPTTPTKVIVHNPTYGLLYSEDFDASVPHWRTVNAGLTEPQYQAINEVILAPNGAIYVAHRSLHNVLASDECFIAYAPFIGGTFSIIEDNASILAKFPASAFVAVCAIGINPLTNQVMYIIAGDLGGAGNKKTYIGSGVSFALGMTFATFGGSSAHLGSLTYGLNNWLYTGGLNTVPYYVINSGGTAVSSTGFVTDGNSFHFRAKGTGKVFLVGSSTSSNTYYSLDNCTTMIQMDSTNGLNNNLDGTNYFDCDPSGMYIVGNGDAGAGKVRSSDGGATFLPIPNLPVGQYRYCYAGGEGVATRWIAVVGVVRYSPDWGASWIDKEGNMLSLTPVISLDLVKAIGYS